MLSAWSLGKQSIKVPNLKPLRLFCPLRVSTRKDFYKDAVLKVRFVIVPSNIQFAGMSTFQPGSWTGCGNEGVNLHVGEVRAERMHEIV